jgi:hypothetical protein
MTLLPGQVLGFPPARGGKRWVGVPDALQGGVAAPAGAAAPASDESDRDFSHSQNTMTQLSGAYHPATTHQHAPPRYCRHPRRLTEDTFARPRG